MKVQPPALLAVAVPSALAPPSDNVTVEPAAAVPVSVTELLELTTPLLITGADGSGTVTSSAFDSRSSRPRSYRSR